MVIKMFNMRKSVNWTFIHNLQLLILIGLFSGNHVIAIPNELPCPFSDSVNITDGALQPNQSIIHDGVEFTTADYARVDYILENGVERISAESHIRGCLCNRKPCIRLCCPYGQVLSVRNATRLCVAHDGFETELLHQNFTNEPAKLGEQFSFVAGRQCEHMYMADDDIQITHGGHVLHESRALEHHEYCIHAKIDEKTNVIDWNLIVCYMETDPHPENIRYTILPICMLISVVFIVATLLVYAFVPKLRNLNGKCLICYLAALAVGYSIISWLQVTQESVGPVCTSVGLVAYFALIAAFLWLNVLNFDQLQNFELSSGFNRLSERKRFFYYCLYGFGIPCILTVLLYIIDQIESIPWHLRPRFGEHTCFLHKDHLTMLLFFYTPLGIIITINIVLFILTAMRIRKVNEEAMKLRSPEDSSKLRKSLNKKRETVTLYFRLFVIAGISWSLEIVSFLVAPDSLIFIASDIWNTLTGLLIFILLVLRRRALRLIKERWNGAQNKSAENASAVTNSNDSANYLRLTTISTPK